MQWTRLLGGTVAVGMALTMTQPALALTDNEINRYTESGRTHLKAQRYDQAESDLNRVLMDDPSNARALNYLGMVYHEQGRYNEAIESYRRAAQADPDFYEPRNNLRRMYQTFSETRNVPERLRNWPSNDRLMLEMRGFMDRDMQANQQLGDRTDEQLTSAADLDTRARYYAQRGDYDRARDLTSRAMEADQRYAGAHRTMGDIRASQADYNNAVQPYSEALAINNEDWDARYNLATSYYNSTLPNRYTLAEENYRSYLDEYPDDYDAMYGLGWSQYRQGRYDDAISTWERARTVRDDDAYVYYGLGDAYWQRYWATGQPDYARQADRYWLMALERDAESVHPLYNLGRTYVVLRDYDYARRTSRLLADRYEQQTLADAVGEQVVLYQPVTARDIKGR